MSEINNVTAAKDDSFNGSEEAILILIHAKPSELSEQVLNGKLIAGTHELKSTKDRNELSVLNVIK